MSDGSRLLWPVISLPEQIKMGGPFVRRATAAPIPIDRMRRVMEILWVPLISCFFVLVVIDNLEQRSQKGWYVVYRFVCRCDRSWKGELLLCQGACEVLSQAADHPAP
jgi:hypothetical protein